MPQIQQRTYIILTAFLLLILAATACSSEPEAEPSVTSDKGNYETCEGFITPDHVESQSGTTGLIDRVHVLDVALIPGLADSGAINNCLIEVFRTLDGTDSPMAGDSVTLSLVRFDTAELAKSLYNSTLASAILTAEQVGDLAEIQQEVVGKDSYLMDVNAGGIGAIVVFVFDSTFVSMSSTDDDESNALLDGQGLVNAAQGVQSRLP